MAGPYRQQIKFQNGYWPSSGLVGSQRMPDSIRDGKNMLILGPGYMKSIKGLAAITIPGGERLYVCGSNIQAVTGSGTGSIIPYINDTFWYLTDGATATINTGGASSTLLTDTAGALMYRDGSTSYTVGLAAPPKLILNAIGAPSISASATIGVNTGDYAVVYTRIRAKTGGESNGSDPSDVVVVAGKKITIQFPAAVAGQTAWGVYVTDPGAATTGPFFHLEDVPIATTIYTKEWTPSQTQGLEPPTDNDLPPKGKFCCSLGPIMVILGSYGGNNTNVYAGVSPSKPNRPEAFPALSTTFLNPAESIIGFAARPTEGELMLWTANSLQALVYTGAATAPVVTRAIWPVTGILGRHGGCFADSEFYAFNSSAGPVLLGNSGDPETGFSQPVRQKMKDDNWDASKVVVGWDAINDAIVYCYQNTAIAYMRSLSRAEGKPIWSPPVDLNVTGPVESAVTVNGQLHFSFAGGGGHTLAQWEKGSLTPSWYIIFAWQEEPDGQDRKTLLGYRTTFDTNAANLQADLLVDLDDTVVSGCSSSTVQIMGNMLPSQAKWKRINKRCRYYTLKVSSMGTDHFFYDAEFEMLYEPNVRETK